MRGARSGGYIRGISGAHRVIHCMETCNFVGLDIVSTTTNGLTMFFPPIRNFRRHEDIKHVARHASVIRFPESSAVLFIGCGWIAAPKNHSTREVGTGGRGGEALVKRFKGVPYDGHCAPRLLLVSFPRAGDRLLCSLGFTIGGLFLSGRKSGERRTNFDRVHFSKGDEDDVVERFFVFLTKARFLFFFF